MTFFLVIWLVLVAAAGGLAIGTLWGRLPSPRLMRHECELRRPLRGVYPQPRVEA